MSYRQTLQVFHPVDVSHYLAVLHSEYDLLENPYQRGTYLLDNPPRPFYQPFFVQDHLAIVSFNYLPLSPLLIKALQAHPELAPPNIYVRWLAEQDLLVQGSLETSLRPSLGKER